MSTNIIDVIYRNTVARVTTGMESCVFLRPSHTSRYIRIIITYYRDPKRDTKVATELCCTIQYPFNDRHKKGVLGLFRRPIWNRIVCNIRPIRSSSCRQSYVRTQHGMDTHWCSVR